MFYLMLCFIVAKEKEEPHRKFNRILILNISNFYHLKVSKCNIKFIDYERNVAEENQIYKYKNWPSTLKPTFICKLYLLLVVISSQTY